MKKISNGLENNRSESPEKSVSKDSLLKSPIQSKKVKYSPKKVAAVKKTAIVNKRNKVTQKSIKVPSITKRFSQLQKIIQDLKIKNKDLKYENEYLRKAALRSMTNFICAKELQEELQQSVRKCKEVEALLNQKNEIIEKYQFLLKEISGNVNILMSELENNNKTDAVLQKQIKKLGQIQQKSERLAINPRSFNYNYVNNKHTFSSSNSDTLIDADLSFETSILSNSQEPRFADFQFKPIKPMQYKVPSTLSSFDGSLSMENNCMSNQEDDNDDNDSITLPLDDMSITTIPTSEIQNSFNESISNISQNEEFQHGLNELDQKIFKAKMLLESIRIK
jgi:hypothetical protein